MIEITDKVKCCGCTACFNICPKKCISMQPDTEGFLYPIVDKKQCVNCGLCEKVCPILNYKPIEEKTPAAYVVRTKNQNDLMQSTSGGLQAMTIIGMSFIENLLRMMWSSQKREDQSMFKVIWEIHIQKFRMN